MNRPIALAVLLCALTATSSARAEEDLYTDLNPAVAAKLKQIGVIVMFGGACAPHLSEAENRDIQAMAKADKIRLHPDDEKYRPAIRKLLADVYMEGAASETLRGLSAQGCRDELRELIGELNRAEARK